MPAHVGHHHVPHGKFGGGMSGFECPFSHRYLLGSASAKRSGDGALDGLSVSLRSLMRLCVKKISRKGASKPSKAPSLPAHSACPKRRRRSALPAHSKKNHFFISSSTAVVIAFTPVRN